MSVIAMFRQLQIQEHLATTKEKADLAASLGVVAVAIGPLPASSGSKPFSMCRNR